jgi:hypothetical protein
MVKALKNEEEVSHIHAGARMCIAPYGGIG